MATGTVLDMVNPRTRSRLIHQRAKRLGYGTEGADPYATPDIVNRRNLGDPLPTGFMGASGYRRLEDGVAGDGATEVGAGGNIYQRRRSSTFGFYVPTEKEQRAAVSEAKSLANKNVIDLYSQTVKRGEVPSKELEERFRAASADIDLGRLGGGNPIAQQVASASRQSTVNTMREKAKIKDSPEAEFVSDRETIMALRKDKRQEAVTKIAELTEKWDKKLPGLLEKGAHWREAYQHMLDSANAEASGLAAKRLAESSSRGTIRANMGGGRVWDSGKRDFVSAPLPTRDATPGMPWRAEEAQGPATEHPANSGNYRSKSIQAEQAPEGLAKGMPWRSEEAQGPATTHDGGVPDRTRRFVSGRMAAAEAERNAGPVVYPAGYEGPGGGYGNPGALSDESAANPPPASPLPVMSSGPRPGVNYANRPSLRDSTLSRAKRAALGFTLDTVYSFQDRVAEARNFFDTDMDLADEFDRRAPML